MAPENPSSVTERLSGVGGELDSLAPVEVRPPDRANDTVGLSVDEARRLVDSRLKELEKMQFVEQAPNKNAYGVEDTATATALNHAPAVTHGISRRVWGGVAAIMATLVAGGAWAQSQGSGRSGAVPGGDRPSAAAEPFHHIDQPPLVTPTTVEAKAPADVVSTTLKPPTSSTTVATPEKAAVESAPTPTLISTDLRAKLSNEYPLLGQVENLKEVNRFSSSHGDVVMVSVEGATPTVSVNELKALVDYFDQETAHPVADTYTITLEDQTKLTIPYTSDYSKVSTRVFVFASQDTDLRRFSPTSFEGGNGFTRYRPDAPSDTGVTILRPSGEGKGSDWMYASQEVCQNTLRVKLDQAFVDQVRRERPDLAKLNFANTSQTNVDLQLYNTGLALQDIKCASEAWALAAVRLNLEYTNYLGQVATMVHPLFKYDKLPYMSVTPAQYASMRAAYKTIHN